MYVIFSEAEIKSCNLDNCEVWTAHLTMLSLLLCKKSQPGDPFVVLLNLKATFQPMGAKGSLLAANKKQETLCCSACELSSEAISALCLCCAAVLPMSPALPLSRPWTGGTGSSLHIVRGAAAHVCRTPSRENKFIPAQWQVARCIAVRLATTIFLTAVQ